MIIITGPQGTDEAVGFLAEMAGLLEALPSFNTSAVQWAAATVLYCLAGWDTCPLAVADVAIAETFGMTIHHLAA
ncbi:hypothetical protein J7I94_19335 [Streptomyces sp. ISL-12]|uniref:hypothetical protein n=1 Tax=Streptomyces sp. ISL-12 TaxID=2819177 RepID=UPI001BEB4F10|nr:hypothetical protein [Streptomyces sp. ISL-12]MBT2412688.1 hypothetical protein [Streptomyces sp. ISL-12]